MSELIWMNGPVFLQEVDHVSFIASCTKENCSDSISDDLECIREETTCVSISRFYTASALAFGLL